MPFKTLSLLLPFIVAAKVIVVVIIIIGKMIIHDAIRSRTPSARAAVLLLPLFTTPHSHLLLFFIRLARYLPHSTEAPVVGMKNIGVNVKPLSNHTENKIRFFLAPSFYGDSSP
jgi:hypothetical protein